jgi:mRNA interferase MazF
VEYPSAGDIVYIDLDPTKGHEQQGKRPCITISVPTMFQYSDVKFGIVIVVPVTSKKKNWWTVVRLKMQEGLQLDSFALCHQIRAVSTERISDIPGRIKEKDLNKIRLVLSGILGMS